MEWEKEFEKVMGCIPECKNGLYEDVGCPAHGYDAIKAKKFLKHALESQMSDLRKEVEKVLERHAQWKPTEGYDSEEEKGFQKGLVAEAKLIKDEVLLLMEKVCGTK